MLRWLTFCASWLAIFPLAAVGTAATIDKTNNTDGLNLGSSWVGATVPGSSDVARWSSVVAGANTVSLGADTNWLGIKVTNPGGAVTVNSGNTLTLGGSGIDMSAATTNLTLNCGLTLLSNQAWNLNSPAALTLGGTVGGANVALSKAGSGTANLNSLNTISGSVAVNAGRLVINHPRALGFTAATVASGAQLYIGTASACTNAITLTGNGTDTQGAVRFNGGTAVWSGPITLVNGARIGGYAGSGAYTLSGGIGDALGALGIARPGEQPGPTVVYQAPPAPLKQAVAPAPGPEYAYAWIPGCWTWQGQWVWAAGSWTPLPHPHAVWIAGQWVKRGSRFIWIRGRWQ